MPKAKDIRQELEEELLDNGQGRVTEIVFKTNRNMDNKEHIGVKLTSTIGETEEVEDVYKYLRDQALYLLYLDDEQ